MGLGGSDPAVTFPRPVGELTYDELHSGLLGLLPGFVIGLGLLLGRFELTFFLALSLIGASGILRAKNVPKIGEALTRLGVRVKRKFPSTATTAGAVIRKEPWYFTTVTCASTLLTYGVGVWPSL